MVKLAPNDQLRAARESRHLSREQLAEQVGASRLNVGRWERGEAIPDHYQIEKLCAFFASSAPELGFPLFVPEVKQNSVHSTIYDPAIPPLPPINLVGRELALAEARDALLLKGSAVLTALNGLPGVGKTTLAIVLAHDEELRAHFQDGVLWAGLGPDPNIQGQLRR